MAVPSDAPERPLTAAHIGKIITEALPAGRSTHSLRHRFATVCYQVDRDLLAVQQLLGHAKPETTARYAAVNREAQYRAVASAGILPAGRAAS